MTPTKILVYSGNRVIGTIEKPTDALEDGFDWCATQTDGNINRSGKRRGESSSFSASVKALMRALGVKL